MATEGLTDGHRRVLCEMLGEYRCNNTVSDCLTDRTRICDYCEYHVLSDLRCFATGNDMMAVKEALVEQGKWDAFYWYGLRVFTAECCAKNIHYVTSQDYAAWLLEPEHFCWLAAEWKMREG